MASTECSVLVRDVSLTLGKRSVLSSVNLSVSSNSIFCLLGPSGSGKTSLMSVCLGILMPDQGQVETSSQRFGFMPQSSALHLYFTPTEAISFYGRLFDMAEADIDLRMTAILDMLHMGHRANTQIGKLSGGERRRISLACSIIHSPHIIVLDEPTVGVDPLLRMTIWRHLRTMSNSATVILTTQCLNEADMGDRVAFIRDGRILVEDHPRALCQKHQLPQLDEQVFLHLCQMDELSQREGGEPRQRGQRQLRRRRRQQQQQQQSLSWHVLRPLISKNWTVLKRHYSFMLLQIFLPVLILIFFTLAIGRDLKHVDVAIVNEDRNDHDNPVCHFEMDCQSLMRPTLTNVRPISCKLIEMLNATNGLSVELFDDYEKALSSVKWGWSRGMLVLPEGFALHTMHNLLVSLGITSTELIEDKRMRVSLDNSDLQVVRTIRLSLIEGMAKVVKEVVQKCNSTSMLTLDPVLLEHVLRSPGFTSHSLFQSSMETSTVFDSLDLTRFMLPGLAVIVLNLLALALTADHLSNERDEGLFTRELVAGVTPQAQIAATLLVQGLVVVIQIAAALALLLVNVLDNNIYCRMLALTLIFLLSSLSGMCLGLVVTALTSSRLQTFQLGSSLIMPFFLLAGIVWPRSTMPQWLFCISSLMPVTLTVELASQVALRPTLTHLSVMGLVVPSLWIAASLMASMILIARWKLRALS